MSLFKAFGKAVIVALGISSGAVLVSGCTLSPVYSGALANPSFELAYSKPNNRLEQIIYQDLALRLGESDASSASLASVNVALSGGESALSGTQNPRKPQQVTVVATLVIVDRANNNRETLRVMRQATAQYTTNGQVLADRLAAEEAQERAAKTAAEALRIAVLAQSVRS